MGIERYTGTAYQDVSKLEYYDGTAYREVTKLEEYTGTAYRTLYTSGQPRFLVSAGTTVGLQVLDTSGTRQTSEESAFSSITGTPVFGLEITEDRIYIGVQLSSPTRYVVRAYTTSGARVAAEDVTLTGTGTFGARAFGVLADGRFVYAVLTSSNRYNVFRRNADGSRTTLASNQFGTPYGLTVTSSRIVVSAHTTENNASLRFVPFDGTLSTSVTLRLGTSRFMRGVTNDGSNLWYMVLRAGVATPMGFRRATLTGASPTEVFRTATQYTKIAYGNVNL